MPESYGKRNIPLMILQKIQLADILFMSFSCVQLEAKKDRKKKMKKMRREERRSKVETRLVSALFIQLRAEKKKHLN